MLRRIALFYLFLLTIFVLGERANAAFYEVSVSAGDVSFSPPEVILGSGTRIYATITNNGERDVEGTVRFYDNESLIGTKPFSVRAAVRPEDAWVPWTPQGYGAHTIRIVVDNDDSFVDALPANNMVSVSVFVDRDTDRDSVPDQGDEDQDNDLILNADERIRGTDPLRADTDGDGVDDRTDAFPLDARRSVVLPVVPTSTPRVIRSVTAPVVPVSRSVVAPLATSTNIVPTIDPSAIVSAGVVEVTTTQEEVVMSAITMNEIEHGEPLSVPLSVQGEASPWNGILAAAAVLSGIAAGLFIWLGQRRS